ncbi:MAG: YndJ family transporter, partial [Polyangiales bacterium]
MRSHELVALSAWVLTTLPALLVAVMTAVLTPLALGVAGVPRWLRLAAWPAGTIAAIGLVLVEDPGAAAVLTVVPYACVAAIAGVIGGARLVARRGPASRIALSVGLVFMPAATLWLVSARGGHELLGYAPFWVLLTAAHFHVAGMYLLIVLGRVTFERGKLAAAIAIACVLSVPLTAAGIYGPRWLEVSAAVGMAASAFGGGVLLVLT